ncbi:Pycsar system effector family protein [Streptomyces sp. SGAir0957]
MLNSITVPAVQAGRPADLQIRYLNRVGAHVDVTGSGEHLQDNRWRCHGCQDASSAPQTDWLWRTREQASAHAAACTAIALTATAPPTNAASLTDKNLDAACTAVAQEVARTDNKSSLLLAFQGAALAGLASVADTNLPLPTKAFGTAAVLCLGAAAVLLLLVVRPRLRGDDRSSFPHWARLDEQQIRSGMDGDQRAARIRVLSQLAVRKYTHLRRAVDLSLAALALLALAAAGLAL